MELSRGDVVIGGNLGEWGKPRPAVVVQSNALNVQHRSVVICPMTSELHGHYYRILLRASEANGLSVDSEVMVDKLVAAKRVKIREITGCLGVEQMDAVDRALALVIGLGEPRRVTRGGARVR